MHDSWDRLLGDSFDSGNQVGLLALSLGGVDSGRQDKGGAQYNDEN
jgi:hypothetical protein